MLISNTDKWANKLFGNANLGDLRRTKRLVKLSSQLASHTGASIVQASGDSASIEGVYRFLRNLMILLKRVLSRYCLHYRHPVKF